ncbi:YaaR family protein [Vallitalea okinawensis]|uniref:YaaR family protein n=1 Tax=Vallitalea okinawensis TaxID=2078660 RepID=UPI000CFD80BA|nr:YaaR family protein [Vallitalea okinawensis]
MDLKVNQIKMPDINSVRATQETDKTKDFKFTLLSKIEEEQLQARLDQILRDIQVQGQKIVDHMDIRDMKQYRLLITEFMNEVVYRSHKFSRENFLDRRGRHRVYGIVKLVNEHLDELAKELLSEEKKQISILDKIGQIKGLLLDLLA